MTEKQKMLSGELYNAATQPLIAQRARAKDLTFRLNQTHPSQEEERSALLRELLGAVGEGFHVESPFQCDYGYNITAGKQLYINHNCVILDCAQVRLGDNVMLGPNVGLYTAGHPLEAKVRSSGLEFAHPITIGDNVWIGGNAVVLGGVTIGENSVIAAGSVVTRDIPPNTLAAGVPCRPIRRLDSGEPQD